jgi:hypothetical protein
VVYGFVDSIWPYPSMPSSVTTRMTGFSPRIAHFRSVIFTLVSLAVVRWYDAARLLL